MRIAAAALEGLGRAQDTLNRTAQRVAANSDLSPTDVVSLISAREQFDTNLQVVHVAYQMEQQAINLLA
jgi:hypothetical protein